jgi:hypothetical protein
MQEASPEKLEDQSAKQQSVVSGKKKREKKGIY